MKTVIFRTTGVLAGSMLIYTYLHPVQTKFDDKTTEFIEKKNEKNAFGITNHLYRDRSGVEYSYQPNLKLNTPYNISGYYYYASSNFRQITEAHEISENISEKKD